MIASASGQQFPLSIKDPASERRIAQRHRSFKSAKISFNHGGSIDCRVRNLSTSGVCLEVASPVHISNWRGTQIDDAVPAHSVAASVPIQREIGNQRNKNSRCDGYFNARRSRADMKDVNAPNNCLSNWRIRLRIALEESGQSL
jgi:hypothetical protein